MRPLYSYGPTDLLIIIEFDELGKAIGMPFDYGFESFKIDLEQGVIVLSLENKFRKDPSHFTLSEKAKELRDYRWKLISPLVKDIPGIFIAEKRYRLIMAVENSPFKATKPTLYLLLKRYWVYGSTINALIPDYCNCGAPGVMKPESTVKKGRSRRSITSVGRNVTPQDIKIFKKHIIRFLKNKTSASVRYLYHEILEKNYVIRTETGALIFDHENLPTEGQFRYWFNKIIIEEGLEKEVTGIKDFNLNKRDLHGSSMDLVDGPGEQFEIDETVSDVYMISIDGSDQYIGRPILYTVIDTFSRVYVGVYLTVEFPSYKCASRAILNAASDKVEMCRKIGLVIEPHDWPIAHLPYKFLADRGALKAKKAESITANLGIDVSLTPKGRADLKGIVERNFKTGNLKMQGFLNDYGAVLNNINSRIKIDNRKNAVLTLHDLTQILILNVLDINNTGIMKKFPITEEMLFDRVDRVRLTIWKWGMEKGIGYCRNKEQHDFIKSALLPRKDCPHTRQGVIYRSIYYVARDPKIAKIMESRRLQGQNRIQVSYDDADMTHVYVNINGAFHPLSQRTKRAQFTKSTPEYDYLISDEQVRQEDLKRLELEQTISTNVKAREIADRAKLKKGKTKVSGARDAKKKEAELFKQVEANNLQNLADDEPEDMQKLSKVPPKGVQKLINRKR